jgi:hemolysin D
MLLPPPLSSKPAGIAARRGDPVPPEILEFQSPSAAILALPVPPAARGTIWAIAALFAACLLEMGLIPIDKVVTAPGKVVSETSKLVVQPLETSIVRSLDVTEGQFVHAGDLLARLDPTFAAADVGALAAQVAALQAEVSRLQAEAEERPYTPTSSDPNLSLQAAIHAQRLAERRFKLETYRQRISGLQAAVARSLAEAEAYRARKSLAEQVESMRRELQRLQVGSRLNALAATDNRMEMERNLATATESAESARRELDALKAERNAYDQNWKVEVSQKLSEQTQKLADAREQLNKAQLRRRMVELRADRDATVLTMAKVSVGSALQSGEQLITLVPADARLEVEAMIEGRDDGFVQAGAPVAIKFDTFPFTQYGLAEGTLRSISPDSFNPQDEAKNRSGSLPVNPASTEAFYRSHITIDAVKLHDLPTGFRILPGMPITADIRVGKRTILTYLLGRILPVASEGMREP